MGVCFCLFAAAIIAVEAFRYDFKVDLNLTNDNGHLFIASAKLTQPRQGARDPENQNAMAPDSGRKSGYDPYNPSGYNANNYSGGSNSGARNQSTRGSGYTDPRRQRINEPIKAPNQVRSTTPPSSDPLSGYYANRMRNNNSVTSGGVSAAGRTNSIPVARGCAMNTVNCALTGVSGEKSKNCMECANLIYSSAHCNKYEPQSFLSIHSLFEHSPSKGQLPSRTETGKGKGGGNWYNDGFSFLEVDDDVTDLETEGLRPLDIEPKVSVHDLLHSYDTQNHVKHHDPYCNDVECLRLKDEKSCISQLRPQNQQKCGSCWIFANTLHLELLLCTESRIKRVRKLSEMYIASCLSTNGRNPCKGGNTYDYSQIISQYEFIPSKEDLRYNVPVMNVCPAWQENWENQKPEIELLTPERNKLNSFKGFILIKRNEYDSAEEFVSLVKDMVREKGSVVISMKGHPVLRGDHDGTRVMQYCQHGHGTHAMVIIGYGIYFTDDNKRRRYWLIRNSWGPYWGDSGNFMLDMDGPPGCNSNVFEYAVVLNVRIKGNGNAVGNGYVPGRINNLGTGKTRKISVEYGNKVYWKIFNMTDEIKSDENDLTREIDCNRAFSISKNRNEECVNKCKKNLHLCNRYSLKDLGPCLFSIDHDYDCMMCGV